MGDLEACERHSAELVAYCAEKKVEQFRLFAASVTRLPRAMREPTEENIAAIRAAIDAKNAVRRAYVTLRFRIPTRRALLAAGDVPSAEATLRKAFAFVEQSGERFWLAELHRLDGRIALKRPEPERARAEACFPGGNRDRPQPGSAPARTARGDRPRPALARRRFGRRSPRAVGADPCRDRGRRDDGRCPHRPRAPRRDRLIFQLQSTS